jgi:PhzF family phenazine biosynthesis protein
VQQCAVGLVEVSISIAATPPLLAFRLPKYEPRAAPEVVTLQAALGEKAVFEAPPQIIDVGPHWVIAQLQDVRMIENLEPDLSLLAKYDRTHKTTGLTVFALGGSGDITVRSFAPADGLNEDPVCGSGNGAVAAYRLGAGQLGELSHYTASQGRQIGRDGQVQVTIRGKDIHVGGQCVTCISGMFDV